MGSSSLPYIGIGELRTSKQAWNAMRRQASGAVGGCPRAASQRARHGYIARLQDY